MLNNFEFNLKNLFYIYFYRKISKITRLKVSNNLNENISTVDTEIFENKEFIKL